MPGRSGALAQHYQAGFSPIKTHISGILLQTMVLADPIISDANVEG